MRLRMLVYAVKKMRSGSAGLSKTERTISVWFGFRGEEDGSPQRDFLLMEGAAQSTWHHGLAQGGTGWQVLRPCCGHGSVCVLVLVPVSPPSPSSFPKLEYNNDKTCVPAVSIRSAGSIRRMDSAPNSGPPKGREHTGTKTSGIPRNEAP